MAVVREEGELRDRLKFLQNAVGAISGPFDSFLALRGIKTLALSAGAGRLTRQHPFLTRSSGWRHAGRAVGDSGLSGLKCRGRMRYEQVSVSERNEEGIRRRLFQEPAKRNCPRNCRR
ncbi:hypothetical protein BG36_19645 [Aquamicrobium defluvii]|uniref:Uncharacterized protein n=1 Tax=Aquamicrobium defluvii TaxID=69279 RepID=A0A011UYV3_9HYPH|nr:hypothetical protein BG36_19645 [Aquamicrobium defluvii]EZQ12620.1 hypothetical protein CF98_35225 [Halopseudomonas bauzanensis]